MSANTSATVKAALDDLDDATDEAPVKPPRPDHYKVFCVSFYTEDLAALDEVVAELKRRGRGRASRSSVLREALRQLDLERMPRVMR